MRVFLMLIILIAYSACRGTNDFVQRPRAYARFELPEKKYVPFSKKHFPFSFEVSKDAIVQRDTSIFFDINDQNPNWVNIYFPKHQATIYLSYIPVKGYSIYKRKKAEGVYTDSVSKNSFQQLLQNSYELVYKHTAKASEIKDSVFVNPRGIQGIFFNISGNTGTKYQFFATDTFTHYLRGVLYFETSPNEDSLRPLNQYYLEDMKHLIATLQWQDAE